MSLEMNLPTKCIDHYYVLEMSDQQLTPFKVKANVCSVCNIDKNLLRINSATGKTKNLRELLIKYGEIDVVEGSICRGCQRKLFHIHEECTSFHNKCQTTFYSSNIKRCSLSQSETTSLLETHGAVSNKKIMTAKRSQNAERNTPESMHDRPSDDTTDNKTIAQLIAETLTVEEYCLTNFDCAAIAQATKTKELNELLDTINALPTGEQSIQQKIITVNDEISATMRKLKTSPSVMLHTDGKSVYETLLNFSWESCVTEFFNNFPALCSIIVSMMLSKERRCNESNIKSLFPKLGLIYGIIVQNRIPYLSRAQRIMSATLMDSLLEVKVCTK
jgi:hypothetical protein